MTQRPTKQMLPPAGCTGYSLPTAFQSFHFYPSACCGFVDLLLHVKPVKSQTAKVSLSEATNSSDYFVQTKKNRSTLPAGGGSFKTQPDWSWFSCFSWKWASNSRPNKRQIHRVVFCILFYKVIVHSEVPVRQKKTAILKLIFLELHL